MTALAIVLLIFGFTALGMSWRAWRCNDSLNCLGRRYGIERWNGESPESYCERIRNRIVLRQGGFR